jgi:hypothetical protein
MFAAFSPDEFIAKQDLVAILGMSFAACFAG